MRATLQGSSRQQRSPQEAKEIFIEALTNIRDEARRYKGDSIRIGAVSHPAHFEAPAFEALFRAAEELDPDFNHPIRMRPSHYGAMLTYPPDFCLEKWGERGPEEDNEPFILMFEQSFDRLRVVLAMVGRYGTAIYYTDTIPWPANQKDIQSIIRKQLVNIGVGEIPAIIMGSEEPAADLSQVRAAIAASFPELIHKIQVPVGGTHYVTAIGAGCIARQIALRPEILRPLDQPYHLPHDEI